MAWAVSAVMRRIAAVAGIVIASLAIGSLLLAPSIVLGYGIKAAERDDREHGR